MDILQDDFEDKARELIDSIKESGVTTGMDVKRIVSFGKFVHKRMLQDYKDRAAAVELASHFLPSGTDAETIVKYAEKIYNFIIDSR